jgi:hypothetical protein
MYVDFGNLPSLSIRSSVERPTGTIANTSLSLSMRRGRISITSPASGAAGRYVPVTFGGSFETVLFVMVRTRSNRSPLATRVAAQFFPGTRASRSPIQRADNDLWPSSARVIANIYVFARSAFEAPGGLAPGCPTLIAASLRIAASSNVTADS